MTLLRRTNPGKEKNRGLTPIFGKSKQGLINRGQSHVR